MWSRKLFIDGAIVLITWFWLLGPVEPFRRDRSSGFIFSRLKILEQVNHRIFHLQKYSHLDTEASRSTTSSFKETRDRSILLRVFLSILGFAGGFDFNIVGNTYNGTPLDFRVLRPKDCWALTDEQQLVADVWKRVDKLYLDRTFNGQDWFSLRQKAIKKDYKTTEEVYQAIRDMLSPLGDPYTRFLPPSQYASLYGTATGSVAGVGVSLFVDGKTNQLTVAEVEPDSPAEKAGLKGGDQLVIIDGKSTSGLSVDDCAGLLRGPADSKVGILVKRGDSATNEDFIITRKAIRIQGVQSFLANKAGKPIGVIRIKTFSKTTSEDVSAAIKQLEAKGAKALVMDLRGNPGGYLGGGIDTAKIFLPGSERIVSVIGRTGIQEEYVTTEDGAETGLPMFLVVDKRTASASEVLSAALKENGRAKLIGEKTFGKGIVQTIEQVSGGAGVAVTIARYETPEGNNINKKGLDVDYPVDCPGSKEVLDCVPNNVL